MSGNESDDTSEHPELSVALRDALPVYEAPATLSAWALEQARQYDRQHDTESSQSQIPRTQSVVHSMGRSFRVVPWQVAAGLILAAAAGWGGGSMQQMTGRRDQAVDQVAGQTVNALVDTHVRSMLPGHLLDVQSTDRHTVKPWFAGRTDIAPPVPELSSSGFPLLGGRLDYVQGHSAAVLVYGRRRHTISLFVWRATSGEPARESTMRDGYALLHWTTGDLSYWAVSDAASADLDAFRAAYSEGPSLSTAPR